MSKRASYILDMDNVMKFVFESNIERDMDSEITEIYTTDEETNELTLATKQLRELKGGDNTSKFTIKYDMLKMFIDMISNLEMNDEVNSFGETLIFNTMINEGLIKEIEE
jgi:hypothetical protein